MKENKNVNADGAAKKEEPAKKPESQSKPEAKKETSSQATPAQSPKKS